jgi:hypothetical protein
MPHDATVLLLGCDCSIARRNWPREQHFLTLKLSKVVPPPSTNPELPEGQSQQLCLDWLSPDSNSYNSLAAQFFLVSLPVYSFPEMRQTSRSRPCTVCSTLVGVPAALSLACPGAPCCCQQVTPPLSGAAPAQQPTGTRRSRTSLVGPAWHRAYTVVQAPPVVGQLALRVGHCLYCTMA